MITKMIKSKKAIGTSVIADIFMILAYLVVFILVIFLTSPEHSKSSVTDESLKIDYTIELMNGLRTPVTLADGSSMNFSEFLAKIIDDCEITGSVNEKELQNAMGQMKLFLRKMEQSDACFDVEYPDSENCASINSFFNIVPKCSSLLSIASSIEFPTQRKHLVKANLYKK